VWHKQIRENSNVVVQREREFFLFIIRAKFQRVFPTKAVKRDLFLLLWSIITNGNQKREKKKGKRKGKGDEIFFATLKKNVEKKKCAGELIFEEEEEAIFFLFKIRP